MIFEYVILKFIWWLLVTTLLIGFAVTGGMDIGSSILLPVIGKDKNDRRYILNSIGPTWEGNQVWLITFGGALFAVWPMVYATAFSSLYFALLLALLMLILRPPGFDYRGKIDSELWVNTWDRCLFGGGVGLALIFGVAIGNLFLGLPFDFDHDFRSMYLGTFFDLLSPTALLFGLVALTMFATQGALFLQYKLEKNLEQRARNAVTIFGTLFILLFILAGIVMYLWIPGYEIMQIPDLNSSFAITHKTVATTSDGWLANYNRYQILWLLPCLCIIGTKIAIICSRYNKPALGLFFNSLSIICAIFTAAVALFPFIIPSSLNPNHSLTVWDASASHTTLEYTLLVVILLLPIVLAYTTWVYRVMRGKVKLNAGSY